jgi:aflatoxin B1 aldehyde reductase
MSERGSYPSSPGMHKTEAIKGALTESLKQLESEYTDIYYLHAPDRSVPFQETLKAINEMYKEGKFKTFALSNFTAAEVSGEDMIARRG